jgi:lipopolysaccharide transport system ATP-binding protein
MSRETVIKVEDVSKQYRLGQVGSGTLSHDLKRWWALARGKEDPFLKVGVENERTKSATSDYTWALRDVNFQLNQGETLGVIGRNGAGKSTLLKLLSRVTSPTTGSIRVKGRIASLLEVGTGFHPELTGRENIFMNGAILGMTRREIKSKFDEIVDFAGVAMYIDTPVKRYSSGMYVRLAFGVAAHLEPEILIVDEVLAVGDAEFQKKCLGKMGDVASHGRTIIFVSHNMQAVQSLCKTSMYMRAGRMVEIGPTDRVVNTYLNKEVQNCEHRKWDLNTDAPGNDKVNITGAELINNKQKKENNTLDVNSAFQLKFEFYNKVDGQLTNLSLKLMSMSGICIFNTTTNAHKLAIGHYSSVLEIPANLLNDDIYTVTLMVVRDTSSVIFKIDDLLTFEIHDVERTGAWFGKWEGAVRPQLNFSISNV